MSTVLVTGASGFVASHVVPELLVGVDAERFRWGLD